MQVAKPVNKAAQVKPVEPQKPVIEDLPTGERGAATIMELIDIDVPTFESPVRGEIFIRGPVLEVDTKLIRELVDAEVKQMDAGLKQLINQVKRFAPKVKGTPKK